MPSNSAPNSILPRILRGLLWLILAAAPLLPAQHAPAQQASPAPPAPTAAGQESPAPAAAATSEPLKVGNYTLTGQGSFGYRFVSLGGNQGEYDQLFNLQQGFRVFDFQMYLRSPEPGKGWFDSLSLTAMGLGGDPFPVIRLDVRKVGVYDLRLSYRTAQYIYGLPQTPYTPNRGWHDLRTFGDANFSYTPTPHLRFHFFYNRTERQGTDLATSPFFYIPLAPDVEQAFGRSNSTPWIVPLQQVSNMFGADLDYQWGLTNVHIEQSYRTYNDPENLEGFASQPISLLGPASPGSNLVIQKWNTFAGFNVPVTSVRVDRDVFRRLQLRAGYIYTHPSGPTSLNGEVVQPPSTTPPITGLANPAGFVSNYIGAGTTNLTTQTVDGGFTLAVFQKVLFSSDYRYQRYSETGIESVTETSAAFPAPLSIAEDKNVWDFGFHTLDTVLTVVPISQISIRAGVRFMKDDIDLITNGATQIGTQRTWSYSPVFSVAWTPRKSFSLRGDIQSEIIVDPYVRIAPEHTAGSTVRAHYKPSDKWGIDNVWSFHNLKTEDIGFVSHSRSNSTSVWYQPVAEIGVQAGVTYGSFSSIDTIGFLTGTPPLTGLLSTDQTIDRTYSLGLKFNPRNNLTLAFSGQYLRSTGLGALTGETSNYGPLTWPAWSAEAGYNTKNVGRVVLGWQHSYYLEDLFRAYDYSANSFTLRFERSF